MNYQNSWISLYGDIEDPFKCVIESDSASFPTLLKAFQNKYNESVNSITKILSSEGELKYAKMIHRIVELIDEGELSIRDILSLLRQYSGHRNYKVPYIYNQYFDDIETLQEAYNPKSKRNNSTEHMDRVFMTPADDWDNENGKWENDFIPEPMSYSDLMGWYNDFYLNYVEAYDTEDEHWTFIYDNKVFFNDEYTNIINQDGDKGKYYDGFERKFVKRVEKNLPPKERFKRVPKRGLVAIIWSNGAEDRFWYKNALGKELLVEYTGWSLEQIGDEWL